MEEAVVWHFQGDWRLFALLLEGLVAMLFDCLGAGAHRGAGTMGFHGFSAIRACCAGVVLSLTIGGASSAGGLPVLGSSHPSPYRLEVLAQVGDVIDGRTIVHFSNENVNVSINNDGEVAFFAVPTGRTGSAIPC